MYLRFFYLKYFLPYIFLVLLENIREYCERTLRKKEYIRSFIEDLRNGKLFLFSGSDHKIQNKGMNWFISNVSIILGTFIRKRLYYWQEICLTRGRIFFKSRWRDCAQFWWSWTVRKSRQASQTALCHINGGESLETNRKWNKEDAFFNMRLSNGCTMYLKHGEDNYEYKIGRWTIHALQINKSTTDKRRFMFITSEKRHHPYICCRFFKNDTLHAKAVSPIEFPTARMSCGRNKEN